MGRFTWHAVPKAPGLLDHIWYWRIGERPPVWISTSRPIKGLEWARLVPSCFRSFHIRYAATHGLHWGPCVLCSKPYGGHQAAGGVPDPTMPYSPDGPWYYVGICPRCTRSRNADAVERGRS
jgi:hypothetical protein